MPNQTKGGTKSQLNPSCLLLKTWQPNSVFVFEYASFVFLNRPLLDVRDTLGTSNSWVEPSCALGCFLRTDIKITCTEIATNTETQWVLSKWPSNVSHFHATQWPWGARSRKWTKVNAEMNGMLTNLVFVIQRLLCIKIPTRQTNTKTILYIGNVTLFLFFN